MTEYKVFVDFDNDGDFTGTGEDITARVLDGRTPVEIGYGRDQARALAPTRPGEASYEVNNASRDYSPENTSSPLTGLVMPGRATIVQAEDDTLGTVVMYRGVWDDMDVKLGLEHRSVGVTCIDGLGRLQGVNVDSAMFQGIRTGDAVHAVLDAAGWPDDLRDVDAGASVLPFWWLDGGDAYTALTEIVDSEGPPALVTVDVDGRIVFRDRHHRLQRAASLTAQATWSSGATEPAYSAPSTYNHGFKDIVNLIEFEVPLRTVAGFDPTPVWSSDTRITVYAGDTLQITIRGSSPFVQALVPVEDVDYTLQSGSPEMTLSRTSGDSAVLSIFSPGVNSYIDGLQVRANAVTSVSTVLIAAQDASSIAEFGPRSLPSDRAPKWASPADARAIADIILGQRSQRLATMTMSMVGSNPLRLAEQLGRDLSDRVYVSDAETGLEADCFVERISHSITQGGAEHRTTFSVEKAAEQVDDVFILGSGVLGTNRLGRRGLSNPANMFVLGSVSNGVLGANILAL